MPAFRFHFHGNLFWRLLSDLQQDVLFVFDIFSLRFNSLIHLKWVRKFLF